mmetsp:Transcript_44222/g.79453  ORF Transcript_44222/g.79453 Transcript_44222/m.79453 type:complete len:101 (+) Transcript_44222:563-865(+)
MTRSTTRGRERTRPPMSGLAQAVVAVVTETKTAIATVIAIAEIAIEGAVARVAAEESAKRRTAVEAAIGAAAKGGREAEALPAAEADFANAAILAHLLRL